MAQLSSSDKLVVTGLVRRISTVSSEEFDSERDVPKAQKIVDTLADILAPSSALSGEIILKRTYKGPGGYGISRKEEKRFGRGMFDLGEYVIRLHDSGFIGHELSFSRESDSQSGYFPDTGIVFRGKKKGVIAIRRYNIHDLKITLPRIRLQFRLALENIGTNYIWKANLNLFERVLYL